MNVKRVFEIVNNSEICDVYYKNHPIWIQEVRNNFAKIGFMDIDDVKDVDVNELYE